MAVWKEPADVATTETLGAVPAFPAFSGVIDGVALEVGNRVLVKDQLMSTENGYYKVVAGVPLTLMATGDPIEAEDVIRVSRGATNAHTAWALIDATNRIFVRQDVKHYSLKSIDELKQLWQVLPDATATVAGYAEPGDKGGGEVTFIGVPKSAQVVNATPESRLIKTVADVDGVVTITTSTPHDLGEPENITTTYISGVTGLANQAYSVRVVNTDTLMINADAPISGAQNAADAQIQYVKLVTAGPHGRVTGQLISVAGVVASGDAVDICFDKDPDGSRHVKVIDRSGVIDKATLSIPIATTGGTYMQGSHAVIGDNGLTVPATEPTGTFGGLWQRLRTDHFDVRWFGAKPNWDGTTGTDNLAAFNACLAAMAADGNLGGKLVARGAFYLSNTLDLVHTIIFEGDGANEPNFGTGVRSAPGTWLVFPKNVTGIRVHSSADFDHPASNANNSVFRNLTIFCKERGATGHGIWASATIHCENVNVQGFAENGFFVSASFVKSKDGNAHGCYFEHCTAGGNGLDGFHIEGGDAQACLVMRCLAAVNQRWGFYDEGISNLYLMCLGEANFGETGKAFGGDYKAAGNNISSFIGCYTEANPNLNQLTGNETIIGGGLSAAQALPVNSTTFAIGPNGVMGNGPLKFANTSGPDATLIEFGSAPTGATGVDGVVLNFSTPDLDAAYNILRWDSQKGWWGIHNASPNGRVSIRFPTTRTAPRRVAPLFENGIFFGSASTLNNPGTSKALVNHMAASATPPEGIWEKGDVVWNTEVTPGGNIGWVCTTAGTNGKLPDGLTTGSIAAGDTTLTVSDEAVTELRLWQYIRIEKVPGTYQIVKVTLPTIVIAPEARESAPSGAAIAGDMVVGVMTARPVKKRDTIVTLNKLDGLVQGQHITIGGEKDPYVIVTINPPTIDIQNRDDAALAPGVLGGAPLGAAITFSEATFATFGEVTNLGNSTSYAVDTPLALADRYLTVTVTGKIMTLPASPADGQTHSIKSQAGVTTAVTTAGDVLLIDGKLTATVAPLQNQTFRYSAATGEWEIR